MRKLVQRERSLYASLEFIHRLLQRHKQDVFLMDRVAKATASLKLIDKETSQFFYHA